MSLSLAGHNDELSTTLRFTYSLNPNLSIQFYGQPFISRGRFSDFKFVNIAAADKFTDRVNIYSQNQITNQNNIYARGSLLLARAAGPSPGPAEPTSVSTTMSGHILQA